MSTIVPPWPYVNFYGNPPEPYFNGNNESERMPYFMPECEPPPGLLGTVRVHAVDNRPGTKCQIDTIIFDGNELNLLPPENYPILGQESPVSFINTGIIEQGEYNSIQITISNVNNASIYFQDSTGNSQTLYNLSSGTHICPINPYIVNIEEAYIQLNQPTIYSYNVSTNSFATGAAACLSSFTTILAYSLQGSEIEVTKFYADETLTTPFDGNGQFYKYSIIGGSGGYSAQIAANGNLSLNQLCPI